MPRFAVLEHHWRGIHWDLLLENGPALRTWSVDAPIEPGREQPARARPDHRMIYLEYEGPISGDRGHVRRVAEGVYTPSVWEAERIVVELIGTPLHGPLELSYRNSAAARGSAVRPAVGWWLRLGNVD